MNIELLSVVTAIQAFRGKDVTGWLVKSLEKKIPNKVIGDLPDSWPLRRALAESFGYKFAEAAQILGAKVHSTATQGVPRRVAVRHPWVRTNKNIVAVWCEKIETHLIFQWCDASTARTSLFPVVTPPGTTRHNQYAEVILPHTCSPSELAAQVERLGEAVWDIQNHIT